MADMFHGRPPRSAAPVCAGVVCRRLTPTVSLGAVAKLAKMATGFRRLPRVSRTEVIVLLIGGDGGNGPRVPPGCEM
eukprot:688688-Rhodomonas_salina.1